MAEKTKEDLIKLDVSLPIWDHFFTVAPLVVIGSKEVEGYDLAPKHMAFPMGWGNYFGFICTPQHGTYHNIKHHGSFTVSYPKPNQMVMTSLAASPRCDQSGSKPALKALETFPAEVIDGIFLKDAYLFLECELHRVIDGFDQNSLITGKIVAAAVDKQSKRTGQEYDQKLLYENRLTAYLYPGRFATLGETLAFPFPSHYRR